MKYYGYLKGRYDCNTVRDGAISYNINDYSSLLFKVMMVKDSDDPDFVLQCNDCNTKLPRVWFDILQDKETSYLFIIDNTYGIMCGNKELISGRIIDDMHLPLARANALTIHDVFYSQRSTLDSYRNVVCDICGEVVDIPIMYSYMLLNGEFTRARICDSCKSTHNKCYCCDVYYKKEELITTKTREGESIVEVPLCPSCLTVNYTMCCSCDVYVHAVHTYRYNGTPYCTVCKKNLHICTTCKDIIHDKNNIFLIGDKKYCKDCYEYEFIEMNKLQQYSYKPSPIFYGSKAVNALYFGVELETDIMSGDNNVLCFKILNDINKKEGIKIPYFYGKRDSSLKESGNKGIEFVSHPMTYEFIMNNKDIFINLFKYKDRLEAFDSINCGMHVHMSKDAFSKIQLYKFMTLVFNNKAKILKLSERLHLNNSQDMIKVDNYCFFNIEQKGYNIKNIAKNKSSSSRIRHAAMNVYNENTVELRIFKGTIELNRFIKNIQICQSMYEYSDIESIKDVSFTKYLKYVKNNKDRFVILAEFIKNKYTMKEGN